MLDEPTDSTTPADETAPAPAKAPRRRRATKAAAPATSPAEAIAEAEGSPSDLPSVYRNLEAFEKLGLIRHVHLGHGPGLYARTSLGDREYLICDACGAHLAVEPGALDEVRDMIRRRFGYQARFTHFPIAGLCRDCAAKDE